MEYDLGIDLGTTYSCAARSRDGRIELVQLGHTTPLIPSVVSLRDDNVFVVGEAAERRAITDPSRTVRDFKRRMGDEAPYVIGGTAYGPEVLAAELLRTIVSQVRDAEGQAARRIALTHPANYGPFKLGKLREAAALAGVAEPMLVPEPVAAALSYAQREQIPDGGHVLVYDLGGGTFDVAVVRVAAGWPEVVGTPDGLERLGGIDFDAAIFNHVDRALDGRIHAADTENPETRAALARLREECQSAKEALSSDTETQIPVLLPGLHETVRLTRGELETMLRTRLEDTFPVLERVVTSAGITMADIAVVLTVGGSSRIPLVAQLLREQTQRPVAVDPNPKASVALGAAMVAGRDSLLVADPTVAVAVVTDDAPAEPTQVIPTVAAVATTGASPAPHRKRRALVAGLVALVVIGGGAVAAFALGGGSGKPHKRAAVHRVTTTTRKKKHHKPTTTTAPATTSPANPGGGNPSSGNYNPPPPNQTHTDPPPTAAPTTTIPPPAVTASSSSGGSLFCFSANDSKTVEVEWSATNATTVDVGPYSGQVPSGSLSGDVECNGPNPAVYTVTAKGPGGTATTTVSWTLKFVQT